MTVSAFDSAETRTVGPDDGPAEETTRELEPGTRVYQYEILAELGKGGMGVVYQAQDHELGRQIALKILRTRKSRSGQDTSIRLKREAQALAQLSHPNVVQVYEVGDFEGSVYLAMELVRGPNVRDWLLDQEPDRKTILKIFAQAGAGLAAAHEADLIHRDFKPENVIVGEDGRVRVLDFGLARANRDNNLSTGEHAFETGDVAITRDSLKTPIALDTPTSELSEELTTGDRFSASLLYARLTHGGGVQGTPAYMSPEQFLGEPVDSRADQYAYCIALFEALCGYRPVKASNLQSLRRRIIRGKFEPFPADRRIPRHIQRALLRGMTRDPEERFPDMSELVRELVRDPAARIRRIALLVALAAAIATASWLLASSRRAPEPPCKRVAERMRQVWNDGATKQLQQVFLATDRSHASDTFERTSTVLDQYANDWTTMRVESCEATHVRGEQSEELLDLRMQCLDARLAEMQSLVEVLGDRPKAEVVDEALQAAYGLPTLAQCADGQALRAIIPPPADPAAQEKLAKLQEQLVAVTTLRLTNNRQQAQTDAEQLVEQARQFDHPPLLAEAAYLAGALAEEVGDPERAEKTLLEAARASAQAGNDLLSARIWIELIATVGHSQARFEEAARLGQVADAELMRAGDPPRLRAQFDTHMGDVAFTAGKTAQAYLRHNRALETFQKELGSDHPDVIESLANIGAVLYRQGQFDEATDINRQALAIGTRALGASHPELFPAHLNLGVSLVPLGQYDEARTHYQKALDIVLQAYGDAHPAAGFLHFNLGELAWFEQRFDEALAAHTKAMTIMEAVYGAEHPLLAHPLTGLGQAQIGLGQVAGAIERLTRAKNMRAAAKAEPAERAVTQFYLQRALWLSGERTPAVQAQAQAAFEVYDNHPYHLEAEAQLMKKWLDALPAPTQP